MLWIGVVWVLAIAALIPTNASVRARRLGQVACVVGFVWVALAKLHHDLPNFWTDTQRFDSRVEPSAAERSNRDASQE